MCSLDQSINLNSILHIQKEEISIMSSTSNLTPNETNLGELMGKKCLKTSFADNDPTNENLEKKSNFFKSKKSSENIKANFTSSGSKSFSIDSILCSNESSQQEDADQRESKSDSAASKIAKKISLFKKMVNKTENGLEALNSKDLINMAAVVAANLNDFSNELIFKNQQSNFNKNQFLINSYDQFLNSQTQNSFLKNCLINQQNTASQFLHLGHQQQQQQQQQPQPQQLPLQNLIIPTSNLNNNSNFNLTSQQTNFFKNLNNSSFSNSSSDSSSSSAKLSPSMSPLGNQTPNLFNKNEANKMNQELNADTVLRNYFASIPTNINRSHNQMQFNEINFAQSQQFNSFNPFVHLHPNNGK